VTRAQASPRNSTKGEADREQWHAWEVVLADAPVNDPDALVAAVNNHILLLHISMNDAMSVRVRQRLTE
jgi:hypothetical protein